MAGPAIGGAVLGLWGIGGCFLVGAILFFVGFVATIGFRYRHPIAGSNGLFAFGNLVAAIRVTIHEKPLAGFFALTLIFNLFCLPIASLVPVIAQDHFQLGARGTGILASMDGVGALAGALILLFHATSAYYGRIFVLSVITYAVAVMAMVVLPHPALAGLALITAGFGSVGFSVMQSTLLFNGVKPEMRAMMLGLFTVTVGIAPLGLLQIGALAEVFGAQNAALMSGAEGLLTIFLTRNLWRHVGTNRG
jgi:hypothetical protein